MKITQGQALSIIEPHIPLLWESVTTAWDKYQLNPNIHIHRRSTRATEFNDLIFAEIIGAFDELPDARIVSDRKRNMRFLLLQETCCLWVKKVNSGRQSSNYLTEHARHLLSGKQLLLLPEISLITMGYMFNKDETAINRLSFNPPFLLRRPKWFFDVMADEAPISMAAGANGPMRVTQQLKPKLVIRRGEKQERLL